MIKQNQTTLNTLHVIIDAVISFSACIASYYLMIIIFNMNMLIEYNYSVKAALIVLFGMAALQILCNFSCDLYRSYRSTGFAFEVLNILRSGLIVFTIMIILVIIMSRLYQYQIPLMFYFFANTFSSVLYRLFLRNILRYLRSKGYNKKFIIILGINDCTEKFIDKITSSPTLGYEIAGYFDTSPHSKLGLPYLGTFKKLSSYLGKCQIDEALIMLSDKSQPYLGHLVAICDNRGIKFSIIPNMFSSFSSRIYISSFDGIPVMSMRKVPLDKIYNKFTKRVLDILGSSIMIILTSPLMIVVAIIIKLTSPGKIIFCQQRVGLDKKPFTMYKFRSMRTETEGDISGTEKNDARCTKIGLFIRKFSIDELPQLFNVLKGNMSLVGPRPEIPYYVNEYRKSVPLYMVKHYVKPGITGWAQVNDLRGNDTSIAERIKLDIYYIEHWSITFDIKILLMTVEKIFFSKNAR